MVSRYLQYNVRDCSAAQFHAVGPREPTVFRCEEHAMSMIPFDDRDGFIWYDGRLIPWRDAKLHVLSHGLHYASCVFEGERVYNGKVFRLEDHNERLCNSGQILGFEVPAGMDDLATATYELISANNIV